MEKSLSHTRSHLGEDTAYSVEIFSKYYNRKPSLSTFFSLRKFPIFAPLKNIPSLPFPFATDSNGRTSITIYVPFTKKSASDSSISAAPSNVQSTRPKSISKRQESWSSAPTLDIYDVYRSIVGRKRREGGGESETERKQRRSFNDIVRVSPEGPATVPPRLRGTSAADVGCRLVRAGWYYSEPFVTRPTRQPLSFSRHPLARPLSRVFIAANRRNMPTRGLPRSSRELEDRLRRGEFSSSFFTHPLRPFSSSFARKDFLRPDRSNGLRDD